MYVDFLLYLNDPHISYQLRLLSVSNLEVSEQLLTGESVPGPCF